MTGDASTTTAHGGGFVWSWTGAVLGIALIAGWFAATRTTMWNAYGNQDTGIRTLSQAQGICDSDIGQLSRTMSVQGAANCAAIDHTAMLWNAAGFTGLLLLVICAVVLGFHAAGRRPGSDAASH